MGSGYASMIGSIISAKRKEHWGIRPLEDGEGLLGGDTADPCRVSHISDTGDVRDILDGISGRAVLLWSSVKEDSGERESRPRLRRLQAPGRRRPGAASIGQCPRKPFNPADSGTADTDEGLRHQIPPAMAAEGYRRGGPPEGEALDGREGRRPPPGRHRLHRRRPLRPRRRLVLRRDAQQPRRGMAPRRRRCAAHGQVRGGPPPGAAHHSGYPHRVCHGERPDKGVRHPCRHPRPGAL